MQTVPPRGSETVPQGRTLLLRKVLRRPQSLCTRPARTGTQKGFRAKQRARRYYGVNEVQFHHYFEMAERKVGVTGENLLRILESRLDNVVYRAGFASSRAEARQLVGHGHFTVNGIRVDIASYLLKAGDVISVAEGSRSSEKIKAVMEANAGRPAPQWLNVNRDAFTVSVVNLPERDAIDAPIEEQLIVEFYSK